MNERIKELYDQANIRYSVYETLKPRDERKNIPDIFAELIVRECAKVAKKVDGDEGDDYKSGRTWAGIDVLKHFGVEE